MNILYGNTSTFVDIAFNNCALEKRLRCIIKSNKDKIANKSSRSEASKLSKINNSLWYKMHEYYFSTIIYSSFALESYINSYGELMLPTALYKEYLEMKLEFKNKWLVLPQLVCNKSIDKSKRGYKLLKDISEARNYLAHDKPESITKNTDYERLQKIAEKALKIKAYECIECIYLLDSEINKIDNTFYSKHDFIDSWKKANWAELKNDNIKYRVENSFPFAGNIVYSIFEYLYMLKDENDFFITTFSKSKNNYIDSFNRIILKMEAG